MKIYCVGCAKDVGARLISGADLYPNSPGLHALPFWQCPACLNYVGCHHKTRDRTRPLGCIPTRELRNARKHLHELIDPLWKQSKIGRKELYQRIGLAVGWEYHTAQLRTLDEARQAYRAALDIRNQIDGGAENDRP